MNNKEKIDKCLRMIEIVPSQIQIEKLVDFYSMVTEKNKVMNLTTIVEFDDFLFKHYLDSLMIDVYEKINNQRIIDIGTGAGFPGIPLKIVFEEINITLIDSLGKRVNFLNEVIDKLELKNITALHTRAEELSRKTEYRESYDIAVSRAVSSLNTLAELCIPFVKKEGKFIAYKSNKAAEEIKQSENAVRILADGRIDSFEYMLPGTEYERTIVRILKRKITDLKYPRAGGKPVKQPL